MAENSDKSGETATLSHRVAEKADKIKYLVLALVVIVTVAIFIVTYQRREAAAREAKAENALYQSEIDLMGTPEMDAVAMFGQAAKDYKGLPAGARALIIQFGHAFNTSQYPAAEQAAREYLKDYAASPLAARARLSLGQALLMQDKTAEALSIFRNLASTGGPDVMPEAKLALAQTLEREAEQFKDDPDEYRRRLEAAAAEYNDIIVRSQINVPAQRGFWPQAVTLPADFALVIIKDKLAGHEHRKPSTPGETPAITQSELEAAAQVAPPSETPAEEPEEATE